MTRRPRWHLLLAAWAIMLQAALAAHGLWHHSHDHHSTHPEQECSICLAVHSPTGDGFAPAPSAIAFAPLTSNAPAFVPMFITIEPRLLLQARGPPKV